MPDPRASPRARARTAASPAAGTRTIAPRERQTDDRPRIPRRDPRGRPVRGQRAPVRHRVRRRDDVDRPGDVARLLLGRRRSSCSSASSGCAVGGCGSTRWTDDRRRSWPGPGSRARSSTSASSRRSRSSPWRSRSSRSTRTRPWSPSPACSSTASGSRPPKIARARPRHRGDGAGGRGPGRPGRRASVSTWSGLGLAFAAALCQVVYFTIGRSGFRDLPGRRGDARRLRDLDPGVSSSPASPRAASPRPSDADRRPELLGIAAITGIVGAAIPSILLLTGIRTIGGVRTGILLLLEPVVGVALAAVLLGQTIVPLQIARRRARPRGRRCCSRPSRSATAGRSS